VTVRLFVGVSGNDEDLEFQAVLHYSLEKYASEPIDLIWMRLSRDGSSFWFADPQRKLGWRTDKWATPFSALRWGIPAACNFEGKAIYMDVDMIAMDDIAKLWNQEIKDGYAMLSKPAAICVSMYDNAKMKKFLPSVEAMKQPGVYRDIRREVMRNGCIQTYKGGNWNCLDMRKDTGGEYKEVSDPEIKVLHFTQIPTQPHLRHAIPRLAKEGRKHWYSSNPPRPHHRKDAVEFFDKMLAEAIANGYTLDRYRNPTPFGEYGR